MRQTTAIPKELYIKAVQRFMANIHYAAHLGTDAARPYRLAYLDAQRKIAETRLR